MYWLYYSDDKGNLEHTPKYLDLKIVIGKPPKWTLLSGLIKTAAHVMYRPRLPQWPRISVVSCSAAGPIFTLFETLRWPRHEAPERTGGSFNTSPLSELIILVGRCALWRYESFWAAVGEGEAGGNRWWDEAGTAAQPWVPRCACARNGGASFCPPFSLRLITLLSDCCFLFSRSPLSLRVGVRLYLPLFSFSPIVLCLYSPDSSSPLVRFSSSVLTLYHFFRFFFRFHPHPLSLNAAFYSPPPPRAFGGKTASSVRFRSLQAAITRRPVYIYFSILRRLFVVGFGEKISNPLSFIL